MAAGARSAAERVARPDGRPSRRSMALDGMGVGLGLAAGMEVGIGIGTGIRMGGGGGAALELGCSPPGATATAIAIVIAIGSWITMAAPVATAAQTLEAAALANAMGDNERR